MDAIALMLMLVALAMQLLAHPALRNPEHRAAAQRAACMLFGACLRIAFRQGLSAGRAMLAVLRGTAWEDQASLLQKAAAGKADPESLPALDAPDAARIADALGRYLRREGAARSCGSGRRVSGSSRDGVGAAYRSNDRARRCMGAHGARAAPREKRMTANPFSHVYFVPFS